MLSWLWYIEVLATIVPYGMLSYVIPLFLLLPVYLIHAPTWYSIERRLYSIFPYIFFNYPARRNFHVKAFGEYEKLQKIIQGSNDDLGIVIVNHQTPSDIACLINFWHRIDPQRDHFSDLSWIQDYLLGVIPTGWVSKIHGDFFVLQTQDVNAVTKCTQCTTSSKTIRERLELNLRKYVRKIVKRHRFIQFFPEAGLFLKRKAGSQRFAEKHGLAELNYVALPKTTGFTNILDELHKNGHVGETSDAARKVKYLICLTVCYPDSERPWSPGDMIASSLFDRKPKTCYIHCHVEPLSNVPRPRMIDGDAESISIQDKMKEPCEQYLIQKYVEMDKVLQKFYTPEDVTCERSDGKLISEGKDAYLIPVFDTYNLDIPVLPMVINYVLGVLALGIFIAVPLCLALYL